MRIVDKQNRRLRLRGQAIMEVLVILIPLTLVVTLVIQCALVGHDNLLSLIDARQQADDAAAVGGALPTTDNIGGWDNGADALRHTADDEWTSAPFPSLFFHKAELQTPYDLDNLDALGLNNDMTQYWNESSIAATANLYQGTGRATVAIEPTLKTFLFLDKSEIELENRVYMPGLTID